MLRGLLFNTQTIPERYFRIAFHRFGVGRRYPIEHRDNTCTQGQRSDDADACISPHAGPHLEERAIQGPADQQANGGTDEDDSHGNE